MRMLLKQYAQSLAECLHRRHLKNVGFLLFTFGKGPTALQRRFSK